MRRCTLLLLLSVSVICSCSFDETDQHDTAYNAVPHGSAHQYFLEQYRGTSQQYTRNTHTAPVAKTRGIVPGINGKVFGYYASWSTTAYNYLDWSLLTHVAYFSADFDTSGNFTATGGWPNGTLASAVRTMAKSNGTKLLVSVTAFVDSIHNAIFHNPTVQQTAINNIINLVVSGDADGIDIDFEGIHSDNKDGFISFVSNVRHQLRAVKPDALVTLATPVVLAGRPAYDIAALEPFTDIFFIMGYAFAGSFSDYAGPNSPIGGGTYNLATSIDDYKSRISDHSKIVMGLPYYGHRWPVTGSEKKAATTGSPSTPTISTTLNDSYTWDDTSHTPWYSEYSSGQWYQTWFENWRSIENKIRLIKSKSIGGMGIWALGWDGGSGDIWRVINKYYNDGYVAPPGSIDNPYEVISFPYVNNSTTVGKEKAFDSYSSAWTINETGPDELYRITIPECGKLTATVSDGTGVDIDLQLMTTSNSSSCVIRHDSSISWQVTPGTWYISADTYLRNSYAGDYTITINFDPSNGTLDRPYLIYNLPCTTNGNTINGFSVISNYAPFNSLPEEGPEEVYMLKVTNYGRIVATVQDDIGIDVDIHILTNNNAASCVARNNLTASYDIFPEPIYLIVDSYGTEGNTKPGAYPLTVDIIPPLLYNDFDDGSLGSWTTTSGYWAHAYTGSVTMGSGAVRLRNNAAIQTTMDTTGKQNISWLFSLAASSLENGEKVVAEYNAEGSWIEVVSFGVNSPDSIYKHYKIDLPAVAENNAALMLRFRLEGGSSDYGFIDRVMVCGE